jgi:hypothetical protein
VKYAAAAAVAAAAGGGGGGLAIGFAESPAGALLLLPMLPNPTAFQDLCYDRPHHYQQQRQQQLEEQEAEEQQVKQVVEGEVVLLQEAQRLWGVLLLTAAAGLGLQGEEEVRR